MIGGAGGRAELVLARVRAIPEGFVRTYGDVSPGAPRFAGAVLSATAEVDLPWWRVVRADGTLAKGRRQRALLEAEGVPLRGDRVDLHLARLPYAGVPLVAPRATSGTSAMDVAADVPPAPTSRSRGTPTA